MESHIESISFHSTTVFTCPGLIFFRIYISTPSYNKKDIYTFKDLIKGIKIFANIFQQSETYFWLERQFIF